jgi:integrase/recombinase XerD
MKITNRTSMLLRINFRVKKQAAGKHSYIYCRIRLNGLVATDFSTYVKYQESWNQENQMFVGKDQFSTEGNEILQTIKDDLKLLYKELTRSGNPDVHDLRNTYVKRAENKTLLNIYDDHMKHAKAMIGKPNFSKGTIKAHTSLHNIIVHYLKYKKRKDINLLEIRQGFGSEFVEYLRFVKGYKQNYIVRNLQHLKGMLDTARRGGYIQNNPLEDLTEQLQAPGPITYLTENEISLLMDPDKLLTKSQRRVADAFLFQCYTGLCYIDLKRFCPVKHIVNIQGRKVIQYARNKTETPFTIPLLSIAQSIIDRYNGTIPIMSNQKMNEYIKVIARTLGIEKYLTTHIGRKTAGTYLLNNDVPMTTVSKILGHRSVKTTEKIYAHLLDETILRHTKHLV